MEYVNLVGVKMKNHSRLYHYDAGDLTLRLFDRVIVETDKGDHMGIVVVEPTRMKRPAGNLRFVIRKANKEDLQIDLDNAKKETEAFDFCYTKISELRLSMKLILVEYIHNANKIIFYFCAEGRVDFRELVKILANYFKARIEMRQIGVRDGAKMLNGIGCCGRELCCSTWLQNFTPVSIRMAKDQSLALNPQKVSGMCGRLMCCLAYEQSSYFELMKEAASSGGEESIDGP